MYDGIRKAVGPTKMLTLPPLCVTEEIICKKDEQLDKRVQHFSLQYSKQNIVNDAALKHIVSLPTMDDLNSKPTIEELSNAITVMDFLKQPGSDGIPVDFFHQ